MFELWYAGIVAVFVLGWFQPFDSRMMANIYWCWIMLDHSWYVPNNRRHRRFADVLAPNRHRAINNRWLWLESRKKNTQRKILLKFHELQNIHNIDLTIRGMGSKIAGISTVCAIVCSGTHHIKHQSSASLTFVRGIHWWLVDSPHNGPVTLKMFRFDDAVMVPERSGGGQPTGFIVTGGFVFFTVMTIHVYLAAKSCSNLSIGTVWPGKTHYCNPIATNNLISVHRIHSKLYHGIAQERRSIRRCPYARLINYILIIRHGN